MPVAAGGQSAPNRVPLPPWQATPQASVSAGERADIRVVSGRVDDRLAASELFAGMTAVLAPGSAVPGLKPTRAVIGDYRAARTLAIRSCMRLRSDGDCGAEACCALVTTATAHRSPRRRTRAS